MEGLAKRYFWLVNLAMLSVLAYLGARLVNNLVAGQIASLETKPRATSDAVTVRLGSDSQSREWAEAIAGRNLFNSEPPEPEAEGSDDGEEDGEEAESLRPSGLPPGPNDPCTVSEAAVGVLATMVAQPSDWSLAIIEDSDAPETRVLREGEKVGDLMLVGIQRSRVVLAKGAAYECVDLGVRAKRTGARPGPARPISSSPAVDSSIKDGVKKTGPESYQIDRTVLDEQLSDISKLSGQARVIPHYRDGKPSGFKMVGVRPGSLFSSIGMRSGDVIKSVAGEEITSPNKALELYERLKTSNSLAVDVERRGRKVTLEYTIK